MRIGRSVLATVAGLALIVAGCSGGGAASPAASPAPSTAARATAAVATPTPADPDALFDLAIAEGSAWKSFHLDIEVGGTVTAAALKATGNPSWANLKTSKSLDGFTIEGDMDPVHLAADLAISVPNMTAAGGAPTTVTLIVIDPLLYIKLSSAGPKYRETKLGTLTGDLGYKVAIPTPGGSSLVGIADDVSNLRKALEAAKVTPTLVGIDQVGGRDAYHIALAVSLDTIDADIASAAAAVKEKAMATFLRQVKIDSASAAIWIYTDSHQLARVQIAGTSSEVGSLSFNMTLTNFDQPVTITAPPASEIAAGR